MGAELEERPLPLHNATQYCFSPGARRGHGHTAWCFETNPPISYLNKKYNLIEHRELSV